jgi:hypothetical protein
MSTLPFRYPLDPTGVNPNNRVVGEIHALPNRTVRAIAPSYGAFFAESLVIRDKVNNARLQSTQFKITEMHEFPTGRYGKEICGIILITDTNVSPNIEIDYQALGGEYSTNADAIIQMLNSVALDNRPVAWGDIISKPDAFEPAFHYHDIGDIYGFEYVVHAVERLRNAVLIGDSASHDEIYRYVDRGNDVQDTRANGIETATNNHINNQNNPHNTTKAQVGLGSVENFGIATTSQAQAGVLNTAYMTPLRVFEAIDARVGGTISGHVNRTDNPHNTTKAQVGLGSVDNFATAAEAEARAGARNDLFMTPLRTAQAISTQAGALLSAHISDQNNPHGTTKAQVGLSLVDNFATSGEADARAGTRNDLFMTPLRVAQAITTQAAALLQTHINNQSNPHNTTKAQVGLGSVDNFATASQADALAGTRNDLFMTPLRVAQVVAQQSGASIQAHLNDQNNPHNTTKAQVGLGNVQNFSVANDSQAQDSGNTSTYVTPRGVFLAINTHSGRTDNPHGVTKAQVGLSNVPNFAVADYSTAVTGSNNGTFMTPYLVAESIESRIAPVRNSINSHISNQSNPHNTTKSQVGLGSVDNFATATSAEVVTGTRSDLFVTPTGVRAAIQASQASTTIVVSEDEWGFEYNPQTKRLTCWGYSPIIYENGALFFWFRKAFTKLRSIQYSSHSQSEAGIGASESAYQLTEVFAASVHRTVGLRGFGVVARRHDGNQADGTYVSYIAEGFADSLPGDAATPWTVCTASQFTGYYNGDTFTTNGGLNGPWTGSYPKGVTAPPPAPPPSGGGGGGGQNEFNNQQL